MGRYNPLAPFVKGEYESPPLLGGKFESPPLLGGEFGKRTLQKCGVFLWLVAFWIPVFAGMTELFAFSGRTSFQDTVLIASLPYTIPASDTAYKIDGRLNSTGNGIYADAKSNFIIVGAHSTAERDDTLNIVSGGGDGAYGIRLERCSNVMIQGLRFRVRNGAAVQDDSLNQLIILDRCDSIWAYDNYLETGGIDSRAVRLTNTSRLKNIEITHNSFDQTQTWFTSRTAYGASLVLSDHQSQTALTGSEYHLRLRKNYFAKSIHSAIALIGRDVIGYGLKVYCDSNTFHMRKRNDKYVLGEGDANTAYSTGDAFAITTDGIQAGSRIGVGDSVLSDDAVVGFNHYGGSGYLLQGCHGTVDDPVIVQGFVMQLNEGKHPSFSTDAQQACVGIYLRKYLEVGSAAADSSYNRHLHIRNGSITISVDADAATNHTGRRYEHIRLGANDSKANGIIIDGIHTDLQYDTSPSDDGPILGAALVYHAYDSVTPVLTGNYWRGYDQVWWLFGTRVEAPANNLISYRDTLSQAVDSDTTIKFYPWSQATSQHHVNNVVWNATWQGNADSSDVQFTNCTNIDSLGKSIEYWQTVRLEIFGADSLPAPNAHVWVANGYYDWYAGQANYLGIFERPVKWFYRHKDCVTDLYAPGDSTGFNPFVFRVFMEDYSDTATTSMNVPGQWLDSLYFDNQAGVAAAAGAKLLIRKASSSDAAWIGTGPGEE